MLTKVPVPAEINPLVVLDWHEATLRREGVHLVNTFLEESYPHGYSWLLCYLWACVRSEFFTADCYRQHLDVANIGGHYYSYRASVRAACEEFAKFEDTNLLEEEPRMLAELEALLAHARKVNPDGDPLPEPPRPQKPPTPIELPEPEPTPEPQPEAPGADWKKKFAWIGTLASVALNVWFIWGNFIPPAISGIIKTVLELIKGVFA